MPANGGYQGAWRIEDSPAWVAGIAWAAGLFEGEGSVYAECEKRKTGRYRLWASLPSTDEDVVRRFALAARCGRIYGPYTQAKSTKPYWHWRTSKAPDVIRLAEEFAPYLGFRRQVQFAEAIEAFQTKQPPKRKAGRTPFARVSSGQMSMGPK